MPLTGKVTPVTGASRVSGFSMALARHLGGRGITVNSVAPGVADIDMTANRIAATGGQSL